MQCGWLKDKLGVAWQIVPRVLGEMMLDKDIMKYEKVAEAMLQMNKIDIEGLKRAYASRYNRR
jgi:predicted 3-demethylubiquinone-9 3-methyltransferase (glyoxalase superfamily)